jgi:hypothetical protein
MNVRNELAAIVERLETIEQKLADLVHTISTAEERKAQNENQDAKVIAEIRFPESAEREGRAEQKKQHRTQKFIAGAAWAAFLSASVYAGLAFFQLREMISTTDATYDAVHETRRNRLQAEKTFTATIDQFHLDQRAWVAVSDIRATNLAIGQPFVVTVVFKNTGKTPAEQMKVASVIDPVAEGQKPDFADPKAISRGLLPPNAEANVRLDATSKSASGITEAGFDQVNAGKLVIYAHGRVTYDDVFGCHHWATFCYFLHNGSSFGVYQEHNDTDHNSCQKTN